MSKILIDMRTQNAAFEDDFAGEVARILRDLANHVEALSPNAMTTLAVRLHDINGNAVGHATFVPEK